MYSFFMGVQEIGNINQKTKLKELVFWKKKIECHKSVNIGQNIALCCFYKCAILKLRNCF